MQKEGWIIIAAAFLLFVCVVASVAMAATSGDAVKAALADDQASATSSLRSTNVCVGFFNIGACTSEQTSTTTTVKASREQSPPSPWSIIIVLSMATLAAVAIALWLFNADN